MHDVRHAANRAGVLQLQDPEFHVTHTICLHDTILGKLE